MRLSIQRSFFVGLLVLLSYVTAFAQETSLASEHREALQTYDILWLEGGEVTNAIAWSPDGGMLAVGTDQNLWLFAEDGKEIARIEQAGGVTALAWRPDSKRIALSSFTSNDPFSFAGNIFIWDIDTFELVASITDLRNAAFSLAWHPTEDLIASGHGGDIYLSNSFSGKVIQIVDILKQPDVPLIVYSLCWLPDGINLAFTTIGIEVLNTDTLNIRPVWPIVHSWGRTTGDCSPEGDRLVVSFGNVFDLVTGEKLARSESNTSGDFTVKWHPTREWIAEYGEHGILIWHAQTGETLRLLESGEREPFGFYHDNAIAWHPKGDRLAEATGDAFVRIWHVNLDD